MDWEEREVRLPDGATQTVRVPRGIDPGWAYNVGETAWGRRLSDEAMEAWRRQGAASWERLTPGDWQSYGRPKSIPLDQPASMPIAPAKFVSEAEEYLRKLLGGEEKAYGIGSEIKIPVMINARTLAEHIPLDRSAFLPFLLELIVDPFEVWLSFERHKGTGKVELRSRFIKAVRLEKGRGLLMMAQSVGGQLEAWTFFPIGNLSYLQKQRAGKLLLAR
ncbi:MAG: hypothetical protein LLG06_01255 [Desulfobacteraceae bacterium]|nr:hypothetical protein [Desulfobacteraceae bacterium]